MSPVIGHTPVPVPAPAADGPGQPERFVCSCGRGPSCEAMVSGLDAMDAADRDLAARAAALPADDDESED